MSAAALSTKAALEELLKARRLRAEAPPLRGEDLRRAPIVSGDPALDSALRGGLPRGAVSEIHGPSSAGRTGLALALVSGVTRRGALAAFVDPGDHLDPGSAAAAGVDFDRLLWLRGGGRGRGGEAPRPLAHAVAATSTLVDSALFDLVVLDLIGASAREMDRLPLTTWTRLRRGVEGSATALLLLLGAHLAHGAGGATIALSSRGPRFAGAPGPGRLLRGLSSEAAIGRLTPRRRSFELHAHSA
jgi:hypothetical protein